MVIRSISVKQPLLDLRRPSRIVAVIAQWCPHCVPTTTDVLSRMGRELAVPVKILDIDIKEEEKEADRLVKEYGDWSPDYLIPQVLFEYENGSMRHVFTGFSEGVGVTKARWNDFLNSETYAALKKS